MNMSTVEPEFQISVFIISYTCDLTVFKTLCLLQETVNHLLSFAVASGQRSLLL